MRRWWQKEAPQCHVTKPSLTRDCAKEGIARDGQLRFGSLHCQISDGYCM